MLKSVSLSSWVILRHKCHKTIFISFFFCVRHHLELVTQQPVHGLQAWYIACNLWSFDKCFGSVEKSANKMRKWRICSWIVYQNSWIVGSDTLTRVEYNFTSEATLLKAFFVCLCTERVNLDYLSFNFLWKLMKPVFGWLQLASKLNSGDYRWRVQIYL